MPGPNQWGLEERYCSRGDVLTLGRGRGKGWGRHVGPLMERRQGGAGTAGLLRAVRQAAQCVKRGPRFSVSLSLSLSARSVPG